MANTLIIIRGLPGSGKSTLARKICRGIDNAVHFENDMFHIANGVYTFRPELAPVAVRWCYESASKAMDDGARLVVVSNVFNRKSSYEQYVTAANERGYEVQIIHVKGDFGNIHNVPEEVLKSMRDSWED